MKTASAQSADTRSDYYLTVNNEPRYKQRIPPLAPEAIRGLFVSLSKPVKSFQLPIIVLVGFELE